MTTDQEKQHAVRVRRKIDSGEPLTEWEHMFRNVSPYMAGGACHACNDANLVNPTVVMTEALSVLTPSVN